MYNGCRSEENRAPLNFDAILVEFACLERGGEGRREQR